ncbi:hypothetical protein RUM43_002755 [Polyplax serrata]|uniref:Uncharacterized protein n=1 Tax=Polyplax serrata TaxID=468196 RepID=A0AAN8PZX8_POLSC
MRQKLTFHVTFHISYTAILFFVTELITSFQKGLTFYGCFDNVAKTSGVRRHIWWTLSTTPEFGDEAQVSSRRKLNVDLQVRKARAGTVDEVKAAAGRTFQAETKGWNPRRRQRGRGGKKEGQMGDVEGAKFAGVGIKNLILLLPSWKGKTAPSCCRRAARGKKSRFNSKSKREREREREETYEEDAGGETGLDSEEVGGGHRKKQQRQKNGKKNFQNPAFNRLNRRIIGKDFGFVSRSLDALRELHLVCRLLSTSAEHREEKKGASRRNRRTLRKRDGAQKPAAKPTKCFVRSGKD